MVFIIFNIGFLNDIKNMFYNKKVFRENAYSRKNNFTCAFGVIISFDYSTAGDIDGSWIWANKLNG